MKKVFKNINKNQRKNRFYTRIKKILSYEEGKKTKIKIAEEECKNYEKICQEYENKVKNIDSFEKNIEKNLKVEYDNFIQKLNRNYPTYRNKGKNKK
jgi:hypothetical protein